MIFPCSDCSLSWTLKSSLLRSVYPNAPPTCMQKTWLCLVSPLLCSTDWFSSSSWSNSFMVSSNQSGGIGWSIWRLWSIQAHMASLRMASKSCLSLITLQKPHRCWNHALSNPIQCSDLIQIFHSLLLKYLCSLLRFQVPWSYLLYSKNSNEYLITINCCSHSIVPCCYYVEYSLQGVTSHLEDYAELLT